MGNLMNKLMETPEEKAKQLKDKLENLEELSRIRLSNIKDELELAIKKDDALPRAGKVNEHEEVTINVLQDNAALNNLIKNGGSFIQSIAGVIGGKENATSLIEKISDVAQVAVDALLGVKRGSSVQQKDYSVIFLNSSLLKINWYNYFYSLTAANWQGSEQVILSILYLRIDVLDIGKCNTDIIIYEACLFSGEKDPEKVGEKGGALAIAAIDLYLKVHAKRIDALEYPNDRKKIKENDDKKPNDEKNDEKKPDDGKKDDKKPEDGKKDE